MIPIDGVVINFQTDPTMIGAMISGNVWMVLKNPFPGKSFIKACAKR
jgi:hypothetical protein